MNEQTKYAIIIICAFIFLGLVIVILSGACLYFYQYLADNTSSKDEFTERIKRACTIVDDLEQQLRERDARLERDKRTISTLQTNIRKSEANNRESEINRQRLDEANRRLAEYDQRERERKVERSGIIEEAIRRIKNIQAAIEKIPTTAMD